MTKRTALVLATMVLASISVPVRAADPPSTNDPQVPPTKVGAFLAKRGSMVVKDFYRLGDLRDTNDSQLSNAEFSALVAYDAGQSSLRIRGIKITVTERGRVDRSHSSLLDIEEAESLLKALTYLRDLGARLQAASPEPWTVEPQTEAVFSTKDDFEIGVFPILHGPVKMFIASGTLGRASFYDDLHLLDRAKTLVEKGVAVLKSADTAGATSGRPQPR